MSLFQAVGSVLSKFAIFSGRARRAEYWWFWLASAVVSGILFYFLVAPDAVVTTGDGTFSFHAEGPGVAIYMLAGLVFFLPSLAVLVRRLHDTGKSGAFIFVFLIPIVGGFILLFRTFKAGDSGPNAYGADPKAA